MNVLFTFRIFNILKWLNIKVQSFNFGVCLRGYNYDDDDY